ncbi:hypothetical protein [Cytobacillus firmus]|uniref:hypothetical protein n=1 Tax=Cytobacillus firmus TaxID=1399 RepID=UPI00222822AF|nr:hypothetical protein [Cytobacillus firmus]
MKMKKKAVKLISASAVMASAFVSASTGVDASSSTDAEKLVRQAESYAGSLKWAISVEGTNKDLTEIPWEYYNKSKELYKKAKEAVSHLKGDERAVLEARLEQNVNLYISTKHGKVGRAVAYIDAVNAGKKIEEKKRILEEQLDKNLIDDKTEKVYHELSREIKKQTILLDRVYGKTTRDAIRDYYKKSAEAVKERALYPVSIKMQLDRAEAALKTSNLTEAEKYISFAKKLIEDSSKLEDYEKNSGIYAKLAKGFVHVNDEYKKVKGPDTSNPAPNPTPDPTPDPTPTPENKEYSSVGTYGPASGLETYNDVTITSNDVVLKNMVIKGDLIISEEVAEGEVFLNNVTVEGTTYVLGGGENSIYFEDSVLATVIVNKNNGAVRIVAQGSTRVIEVQLESYVKIEERDLDENAEGFTNVTVNETVQSDNDDLNVELIGAFETINSRASQVRINLSASTDIRTLILNAVATVLGEGQVRTAEVNANGSTLSARPQNMVLNNGTSVTVGEETITDSYSDAAATSLKSAKLTQASISVEYNDFVAGINQDDLVVKATLDGEDYELEGLRYIPDQNRFVFNPIPLDGNLGKKLKVTVEAAADSEVLEGQSITSQEVELSYGFEGRITDVAEIGFEGVTIKFREGSSATEGAIVAEAITDKHGYYWVQLDHSGEFTGEFAGPNVVTSYMYASAPDDIFNTNQNETAIRVAASSELKIMLSWGQHPEDLDSHLVGDMVDGSNFHTYFGDKVFVDDETGITYVDLDWDDTESFGPETTTIRKLKDGKYVFYVHHYYGDNTLRTSNANVKVFKGNSQTANETFTVPSGEGNELYWVVFALDIKNNGRDVNIIPINELEESEVEEDYYVNPVQSLQNLISEGENVLSENEDNSELEEEKAALSKAILDGKATLENEGSTINQLIAGIRAINLALQAIYPEDVPYLEDLYIDVNENFSFSVDDYFVEHLGMDSETISYSIDPVSYNLIEADLYVDEYGINQLGITGLQPGTETISITAADDTGRTETANLNVYINDIEEVPVILESQVFLDEDSNSKFSASDIISLTYNQDLSQIDLPAAVAVTIVDEGDQDIIRFADPVSGEILTFYTGDVTAEGVVFAGETEIDIQDGQKLNIKLGTITSGQESSLKTVAFPLNLSETPVEIEEGAENGENSTDHILGEGLRIASGTDPSTFTIEGLPAMPEGAIKFKIKPEEDNYLDIQAGTVFEGEDCSEGMTFPMNESGFGYSLAAVDENDKVIAYTYFPNPLSPEHAE